jgi:large subunit ribosomal protein L15
MDIVIVNIDQLKVFPEGTVVDAEALVNCGVLNRRGDGIKVLGKGEIGYPLQLKVNRISVEARKKIEAAGGTVEEVA